MRIIYCIDSINGIGGIQRVTVTKANAMAALPGNEVWVLLADNSGKRVFELSGNVHEIDLGINYYEDDWKSRWNVLKGIFIKRRVHRKKVEEELRRICPDIVVGVGQSEKNFLPRIKGNWATVREFHFVRDYRRRIASGWVERATAIMGDLIERSFTLDKYDSIVLLTKEDRDTNWKGRRNVSVIPNPVTLQQNRTALLDNKRIIALGRLTFQKNFASLIKAFSIVADRHPDWKLDILGEGADRVALEKEIHRLALTDMVFLRGSQSNVQEWLLESSIFVMTSRFEGFSLVLLEAMSCGLPAVSYATPCGPRDLISDGQSGFLVAEGDETALAERICRLIEDRQLRKNFGTAAKEHAQALSLENIIPKWTSLFEELMEKKKK